MAFLFAAACGDEDPKAKFDPSSTGLEAPFASCDAPAQSVSPEDTSVLINEVFAGSLVDESEDWFELHNAGRAAVALGGWVVEDRFTGDTPKEVPGRFEFLEGTTLCPGDYYVIQRDTGCEADTLEFGIGSSDRLVLTHSSGVVVDDVAWQYLPQGQAMGRRHDEKGTFGRLARPTPGYSNAEECECCGECMVGRCTPRDGACVVVQETDCLDSEACRQLGWCGLADGRCQALDPSHCQSSRQCSEKGRCGLAEGICAVTTDADCRSAKVCENEGRCGADPGTSTCVATSQADCEQSDDCLHTDPAGAVLSRKGRCTLSEDRCVATSCEDTSVCIEKACCTLFDGKCVSVAPSP